MGRRTNTGRVPKKVCFVKKKAAFRARAGRRRKSRERSGKLATGVQGFVHKTKPGKCRRDALRGSAVRRYGDERASEGRDAAACANGACGGGRAYCLSPDGCGASGGLCGGVRDEPEMCYDSAMNFVYPAYLLILWFLPVIGIVLWWKRHRYRSAARLFRGGTAPIRPERRFIAQSLLCLAGAGLILLAQ